MTARRHRGRLVPSGAVALFLACFVVAGCSSSNDPAAPTPSNERAAEAPTTTSAPLESTSSSDTTAVPGTSSPVPEPASTNDLADLAGRIALRNAEGDLIVSRPDGSDQVVVAAASGRLLSQPTWANAADRLAWSTLGQDGAAVEIGTLDGAVSTIELQSPPFYLSWSPQDTWIGALRPIPSSIEFLVVETSTTTPRAVGAGQPFYFGWRDDTELVAAINGGALAHIPAAPTAPPVQLGLELPLGPFQAPGVLEAASPRTVVAVRGEGTNDVVILDDGRIETTLGRAGGPVSIAVSPDETQIAVLSLSTEPQSQVISFQTDSVPELADGRVSIIDVDSGLVQTRPEQGVLAMQWSPDGSSLAMLQAAGELAQWLVLDGDSTTALTPFAPSREFAGAYLPFSDQYNHSSTWWSPDGRALVLSGSVGSDSGVWVDLVDDSRGAVKVADGDIALWSPE